MKRILLAAVLAATTAFANAASIEGKWQTRDDATGKPKAIVQISKTGNTYTGRIVGLAADVPTSCAETCAYKGQLLGLTVVRGLTQESDDSYVNGKIYDPKNGKTYSSKASVSGNTLKVRGYIGISAFGRTQTWTRVN